MTPTTCKDSYRVVKTAWRIATTPNLRAIVDIDELMRRSRRTANLAYLDARQHRRACELVLEYDDASLGRWLAQMAEEQE